MVVFLPCRRKIMTYNLIVPHQPVFAEDEHVLHANHSEGYKETLSKKPLSKMSKDAKKGAEGISGIDRPESQPPIYVVPPWLQRSVSSRAWMLSRTEVCRRLLLISPLIETVEECAPLTLLCATILTEK